VLHRRILDRFYHLCPQYFPDACPNIQKIDSITVVRCLSKEVGELFFPRPPIKVVEEEIPNVTKLHYHVQIVLQQLLERMLV